MDNDNFESQALDVGAVKASPSAAASARTHQQFNVSLPGFVNDSSIGLGDAVKHVTSQMGFRPCGGCERRAAALNRWLGFSGRRTE